MKYKIQSRTSLVVQWFGIFLVMQGHGFDPLSERI